MLSLQIVIMKQLIFSRLVITLFLLLTAAVSVRGNIRVYDSKDGLSNNFITAICKDDYGMMWIGTRNGLNFFDGYVFNKIEGELNRLEITRLEFNKADQTLWVGTVSGLYAVNTKTLKSERLMLPLPPTQLGDEYVAGFLLRQGVSATNVLIAFNNGWITQVASNGKLQLITRLPIRLCNRIDMALYPDGDLFAVASGSAYRIDRAQNTVSLLDLSLPQGTKIQIASLTKYRNDQLLLSTYNTGVWVYDMTKEKLTVPPLFATQHRERDLLYAAVRKGENLYIATPGYVCYVMNSNSGAINYISEKNKSVFEGKQFGCLFVDEQDIMWYGTNKGIIRYKEDSRLFERLLSGQNPQISTRGIVQDGDGDLFVASYDGLFLFSQKSHKWLRYFEEAGEKNPQRWGVPYSLLYASDSNIYLGTESRHLFRIDKKNKTLEAGFYTKKTDEPLGAVYAITEGPDKTIWLGTQNGLFTYHPGSGVLQQYHNANLFNGEKVMIHALTFSRDQKKILLATTDGFYAMDTSGNIEAHLNQGSNPALSNDDIFALYEDRQNRIYLATNGGGINIIDKKYHTISYLKKENGLSSDIVYSILPDNADNLWFSTFDGLSRYDIRDNSLLNYYTDQGLSTDEFNKASAYKAPDGKLYFGGINGVNAFYPQKMTNKSYPGFYVFLASVSKWDNDTKSITTLHQERTQSAHIIKKPSDILMELHFACSDYTDPAKNKYFYKIKGLNSDWVSLDNRRSFNISGIPYGKYVLEVKAMNARSIWAENVLQIQLEIQVPLYKRWWFYLLLCFVIAGIIYSFYRFKIDRLKALVHLRTQIASNLHDEVGSLLTRITMFSDNLQYGNNDTRQQQTKLGKIARLSREATASMSDVLWTIDARNDSTGNLTDRMREHAEEMLMPLGIDLNFDFSQTEAKQQLQPEERRDIYLIYKEAINNIARHAQDATYTEVIFVRDGKQLLLCITNDGVQQDPDTLPAGQGLDNMKMRAKKLNATITMTFKDHKFTIQLKKQ